VIRRRLAAWLLGILAVHALAFLMVRATRGGPFDEERALPPETVAALREQYGLDDPLPVQYLRALRGLATLDFGPSLRYRDTEVRTLLADALPVSLGLGGGALLLALLVGCAGGLWAAARAGRAADHAVTVAATLLLALPNFVLAGFAVALFTFTLGWLPPAGNGGLRHFLLPCASLGLPLAAQVARLTRGAAREVWGSDAVRAARAQGLAPRTILLRFVLRPSLVPVVAFLGPATAALLTGSLVVEQVFALPGLGTHFVQAALNRDYTLALGVTVVYTALLGLCTLLADLLLARLDPRVEAMS
jgi:oligopeptide transport system permease protein